MGGKTRSDGSRLKQREFGGLGEGTAAEQEVKKLKGVWYLERGKGGENHIKKLLRKARGNVAEEKGFGLKEKAL